MADTGAGQHIAFPGMGVPIADLQTGQVGIGWYQFLYTLWLRSGGSEGDSMVPSGAMLAWPGEVVNVPLGWFICDGGVVSRTVYADLFTAIGTIYGAGDGFTTFALPMARGRFIYGVDAGHPLASVGGAEAYSIAIANLPGHNHVVTDPGHIHTVTDPGHFHSAVVAGNTVTAGAAAGGVAAVVGSTGTKVTGLTVNSATTGVTTENTGGGVALPTVPPYIAMNWMIKQ